jgi:hypothetical protein
VPSAVSAAPTTSTALEPNRFASAPERIPATKVAAVCGSSNRPDSVTETPNP